MAFHRTSRLLLLCLSSLSSCADDGALAAPRLPVVTTEAFPLRLQLSAGGELLIPRPPSRVLCSNAAWVDFVTLLIGRDRLVALPVEAFGYSRLTGHEAEWEAFPRLSVFDAERALALEPDLVLGHSWQKPESFDALRRAGVPALTIPVPDRWEEIEETLALLGTILDVPERLLELQREHRDRIGVLRARARPFADYRVLSYTNLGAGGWTAGAGTTADVLISLAGLRNAAAEAHLVGDVPADRERLLALDPDVFLVGLPDASESSPPSADFLLNDPDLLVSLEALRERRIVALAPALFTTLSPELLRGAEELVEALATFEPGPRR